MININHEIDISSNIKSILEISENQIAVKISNPLVEVEDVVSPFMVSLCGFHNSPAPEQETIIFIPLIEQYFHNFFEVFSRLMLLKEKGENFKVALVRDDEIQNGIFLSLIKNHPGAVRNAVHVKDFFIYKDIEFICVSSEEAKNMSAAHTFLFFYKDKKTEKDISRRKHTIFYKESPYGLTKFLDFMTHLVFLENVDILRKSFPQYAMQDQYKIFISRSKAKDRRYEQEKDFEKMVIDLGYKIVHLEDINIIDQVALVQSASHIICPYGSALVNASLSSNTKILSVNYTPEYHVPHYDYFINKYSLDYTQIDLLPSDPILSIKDIILNWENKQ